MMQKNVLVVDDHPEIRDLMVKILEKEVTRSRPHPTAMTPLPKSLWTGPIW